MGLHRATLETAKTLGKMVSHGDFVVDYHFILVRLLGRLLERLSTGRSRIFLPRNDDCPGHFGSRRRGNTPQNLGRFSPGTPYSLGMSWQNKDGTPVETPRRPHCPTIDALRDWADRDRKRQRQLTAWLLHNLVGFSTREIALLEGTTDRTIRNWLNCVREALPEAVSRD